MFDCIIVGAGPAGLNAAMYLKRANKNILVLDQSAPGGKLLEIKRLDNYPGYILTDGQTLASKLYNQFNEYKIDLRIENVISITNDLDVITTNNKYKAKYIILATGRNIKTLGLKNEDKYIGKGISYCVTCDGFFYKNKTVGIVGNTKKTLDECLLLTNLCKKVYLFSNKLNINNDKVEIIKEPITELIGQDYLEGIITTKNIDLQGLFIVDGNNNTNYLLNNNITMQNGFILVDEKYQTSVNKIYAIGDCINKDLYQIITAQADGAIVATNIIKEMEQ